MTRPPRPGEFSDYHEADNPEQVAPSHGPKWRPVFYVDAEGYALCSPAPYWIAPDQMTSAQWMEYMRSSADKHPLPPQDVVWWEPDWPRDEDGRGLSVQEVKGDAYMRHMEIQQARSLREWERQYRERAA